MIKSLPFAILALAVVIPVHGVEPEKAATVTIEIRNFRFIPNRVIVKPGTTIRWINRDNVAHDVTSGTAVTGRRARETSRTRLPDGRFSSGPFAPESDYRVTLGKAGDYPYYCSIHPFMTGEIIVR